MYAPLAAPAAAGFSGGQILGPITATGLAAAMTLALILGIRGSDRIKINNRDRAGWCGIITCTLWLGAGGTWADFAHSFGTVPTSILGSGSMIGDPGRGGIALILTVLTFAPRWKRTVYPALLGIAAAAVYASAGGVWQILINTVRLAVGKIVGAA